MAREIDTSLKCLADMKPGDHIDVYGEPNLPVEVLMALEKVGYLKAGEVRPGEFRWIKQ